MVSKIELGHLTEGSLQHEADPDDLRRPIGQPDDGPATKIVELPWLLRGRRLSRHPLLQIGQGHLPRSVTDLVPRQLPATTSDKADRFPALLSRIISDHFLTVTTIDT
ncbi:hypothetical protein ACIBPB_26635 [Micromonospora sp. NPDC049836]|uniref:hypothetical protein n=1 Tax=Micromonospora sp. NPDC049836 TaxID=3364274 RepID=UPI00379439B2